MSQPSFRTHYDNLKVSMDAPPEVIRAAYKALSLKLHPDLNAADPEASRKMAIVNRSYQVLSDPLLRAKHDLWIHSELGRLHTSQTTPDTSDSGGLEDSAGPPVTSASKYPSPPRASQDAPRPVEGRPNRFRAVLSSFEFRSFAALAIFVGVGFFVAEHERRFRTKTAAEPKARVGVVSDSSNISQDPKPGPFSESLAQSRLPSSATPVRPQYVRPTMAPNGSPWPQGAGYIDGYAVQRTGGLSQLAVDNARNTSDVYVKVFDLSNRSSPRPVRHAFIPAGERFSFEELASGSYDIRYLDLDSGGRLKSEPVVLRQFAVDGGIQYSRVEMTLYKVQNGNMKTEPISEEEFEGTPD